jgi:transposase-like protein
MPWRRWRPAGDTKKVGGLLLGARGRLTSAAYRRKSIELISEAHTAGAGLVSACSAIGICLRTLKRWRQRLLDDGDGEDRRQGSPAIFSIASRPRSARRSCSPAINPSTPRCHRVRSCLIWLTRGFLSVQRAASTGCSTTMTRCTVVVAQGHRRSPDVFHGCGPQARTRCGAGTSPICPPPCVGSGFTSTW